MVFVDTLGHCPWLHSILFLDQIENALFYKGARYEETANPI